MKRKILGMYYKSVMLAVMTVCVVWLSLSYLLIFNNRSVDTDLPQYLIRSASQYIEMSVDGEVYVDNQLIKRMGKYDVWLQVLDPDGRQIYGSSVPETIPTKYSSYELLDACLKSDAIEGYTLFAVELDEHSDYGVVMGCKSSLVGKLSNTYTKNGMDQIKDVILLFLVVSVATIILIGIPFTAKIAKPVSSIIDNINEISQNNYMEKKYKGKIFREVFTELRKMDENLKYTNKMRSEWIVNISHDIKTPLSTIKGYAEILGNEEYIMQGDEVSLYAGEIMRAENTIEELIGELKLSERLNSGESALKMEKTDVTELLYECVRDIDGKTKSSSRINIHSETESFIICDKGLLKRCILNIIYNAILYNDPGVSIDIYVQGNKPVELVIEDNGTGIKKGELEHIFERYYRGTNTANTKGTGLGLAIAKEIVVAHGGTIDVKSSEGDGTKFIITI